MIHRAIFDDEKDFVAHLTGLVNQYAAETGGEIKVTAYYDRMELIEKYDTTIDLIFLDIQMRLVNGLRTAERIRHMDALLKLLVCRPLGLVCPCYGCRGIFHIPFYTYATCNLYADFEYLYNPDSVYLFQESGETKHCRPVENYRLIHFYQKSEDNQA